jgi:hypothetical protein
MTSQHFPYRLDKRWESDRKRREEEAHEEGSETQSGCQQARDEEARDCQEAHREA